MPIGARTIPEGCGSWMRGKAPPGNPTLPEGRVGSGILELSKAGGKMPPREPHYPRGMRYPGRGGKAPREPHYFLKDAVPWSGRKRGVK